MTVTSVEPMSYDCEEAARRLGSIVTPDWLKRHARYYPHLRAGRGRGRSGRIAFTAEHLAIILADLEQTPAEKPVPAPAEQFRSVVTRRRTA